jgi:glutaconate CoA-transferase subunit B
MSAVDYLVRAAREFRRGGYVFTGFHWPVLAARLARRLPGAEFAEVYEAGAVCLDDAATLPTSTTDYPAYANATAWRGGTGDVLLGLVGRCDRVVLDAANVDLLGRVNSTMIGPADAPKVRLAGGGGAPEAAAAARELVLLHGGPDPARIQRAVEHVTAAPAPGVPVVLHTRWGVLDLGAAPSLREIAAGTGGSAGAGGTAGPEGTAAFLDHLRRLGVPAGAARPAHAATGPEREAALAVLTEAAGRGYAVARRALDEEGRT